MNRVLGGTLLAAAVLVASACTKTDAPPEPVRAVRTATVSGETAGGTQEYAAEVRARAETRLGFRVGGKMVERRAEVGRKFGAGELLARLDPEDLRLGQEAARASVSAAQVNHELAQADFKRFKDLRDQGFISGAELDRREAALKSAHAQWEQARAQAGVQGNQAAYSALTAPAAGIVTAVEAEVGSVLAAGTPVLRLALDGPRDVVFAVPEDAIEGVRKLLGKPGAVAIRLWATGERFPATVREIGAAADPVTRTFQVKADLPADRVQLGQTATVLIDLPRAQGVARLPLTAVAERQGGSAVWVVNRGDLTVRSRPVVIAGAEGNEILVRSGVGPGDLVVTAGVHVLSEGQKVRLLAAAGSAVPQAAEARADATPLTRR